MTIKRLDTLISKYRTSIEQTLHPELRLYYMELIVVCELAKKAL